MAHSFHPMIVHVLYYCISIEEILIYNMEADIFNSVEPEDSNHIMPTVQQHQDINIEEDTPIERKHPLEESHITSPISEKKEVLSPQAINE
jgi:hypothetical protein